MTADKTIRERGITSTASQETSSLNQGEVFSADTRKLELLSYYVFCGQHGLITTSGEQSRKMLIRKTFVSKGGTGLTWEEAMSSWLISQLTTVPSEPTILNLWQAYFAKYSIVADGEGITYAGLSVEAGYKKYLFENIQSLDSYNDQIASSDAFRTMLGKVFSDPVAATDVMTFVKTMLRTFSDSVTAGTTTVAFSENKGMIDSINSVDSHYLSSTKVFSDSFQILDAFALAGAGSSLYQSETSMQDSATILMSKVFSGDAISFSDGISKQQQLVFEDSFSFSDGIDFILGALHTQYDLVEVTEYVLILQMKKFEDSTEIQDGADYGFTDYNGGTFGQYYFGA